MYSIPYIDQNFEQNFILKLVFENYGISLGYYTTYRYVVVGLCQGTASVFGSSQ